MKTEKAKDVLAKVIVAIVALVCLVILFHLGSFVFELFTGLGLISQVMLGLLQCAVMLVGIGLLLYLLVAIPYGLTMWAVARLRGVKL